MVEHTRDDEQTESFDLTIRVPGVAYDVGQPGFPRVLVVQKLADTVTEYDDSRPDDDKGQAEYLKNALVRTQPDDAVYQCVYLPDSPMGRSELNDPKTRYPTPESRLIPLRADRASPIDDSPTWTAREAVEVDTLESLFDVAYALDSAPDPDTLEDMAAGTGINTDVVQSARDAAKAHADFHDEAALDDGDGPDMELKRAGEGDPDDAPDVTPVGEAPDEADGESETERDDPPEPPADGGPDGVDDLSDGELGDFDPSDDL